MVIRKKIRSSTTGKEEIIEPCDEPNPWQRCALGYEYLIMIEDERTLQRWHIVPEEKEKE